MKDIYLTTLRQVSTSTESFRQAAQELSRLLAAAAAHEIPTRTVQTQTPLGLLDGKILAERVVLTTILRAGLAMLPAFVELFPAAPIGFFGIRRDEKTAEPHQYYQNLPKLSNKDYVFLLDPMLATGGSTSLALKKLSEAGARLEKICLVSIIAAKVGYERIRRDFPSVKIITAGIDPILNDKKFIVPGLGDFGDRYFGT